jgi:hypothetical protein
MKTKPHWFALGNVFRSLMSVRARRGLWSRRGYMPLLGATSSVRCNMSIDTGLDLTQDVIPLLYRLLCQYDDPTVDTNLIASNVSIMYGDPIQCAIDGLKYVYIYCKGVEKLFYSQCVDAFSQLTPFLCDIRVLSSSASKTATIVLKMRVTEADHLSLKTGRLVCTQATNATSMECPMLVKVGLGIIQPSIERLQMSEGSTLFSRLHTTDKLIVVNIMNLLEVLLGTLSPYNPNTISCDALPTCAHSFNIENTISVDNQRDTLGTLKLSCKAIFDISVKDVSCLIHASTTHIERVWFDLAQSTLVVEWQAYGAPITNSWLSTEFIGGGGVVKRSNIDNHPSSQNPGMDYTREEHPLHTWDPFI